MMRAPADPQPQANNTLTLPQNIQAEQSVIGILLYDNSQLEKIEDMLEPQHFFEPLHGRIYDLIRLTVAQNTVANPVTMQAAFERDEPLKPGFTIVDYMVNLVVHMPPSTGIRSYAKLIRDLSLRRDLIRLGRDLTDAAANASEEIDPSVLLEEAEGALYDIAETGGPKARLVSMADAAYRAVETANAAYQRRGSSGLLTGLIDLDSKLGGLKDTDLIILAGRPSMGKSALAANIAVNIARRGKQVLTDEGRLERIKAPVLFFSLEMSAEQVANRIISSAAEVPSDTISKGMAAEDEIKRYVLAADEVSKLPLHIEETGGIGVAQLAVVSRRFKRKHGLGAVVVDYLQLMRGSGKRSDNRVQEVTEITTGLKALAKELNVPVLALSQLSRAVEGRDNKRPQLADLRDSGSIEQDADVVMFVYREEYYVERQKPDEGDFDKYQDWVARMNGCRNKAEVIIGKQRHGPIGTVTLQFTSALTQFSDLAPDGRTP